MTGLYPFFIHYRTPKGGALVPLCQLFDASALPVSNQGSVQSTAV